jgi:hypothetical protein
MVPRLLLLCALFPLTAVAVPSGVLTHEGRLFDATDRPVDGVVDFTFALYTEATGGAVAWSEARGAVPVTQGVYALALGESTPIPASLFAAGELFLSVSVGTDGELLPRLRLGTVPFAVVAATATDTTRLGGLAADDYLTRADAASTYARSKDLEPMLSRDEAATTYAPFSSLDGYLKTADAAKSYAPLATLDGYVKTTDAESTYAHASALAAYAKVSDLATVAFTGDVSASLTPYLKSADARSTYISNSDATSTYLTKAAAAALLSSADAASTYLKSSDATSNYLSKTSAASTYLTTTAAASTYLTTTDAASNYLSKTSAASTYLTTTNATSSYLSKTDAGLTYAPLFSPALTGTPTAPTPATSTNSTAVATTAFVKAQGYVAGSGTTGYLPKFSGTSTLANSALVESGGKLGVGVTSPAEAVDVAGNVQTQATLTVDGGTPTSYPVTTKEYIVEATPAMVGRLIPLDTTIVEALCRDKDGCDVVLQMLNWDAAGKPGLSTTRRGFMHVSETSRWFRYFEGGGDLLDGNNSVDEIGQYDCILTDAEIAADFNNGRYDVGAGWGLLNFKGGSYSDTTTTCRLVVKD